MNAYEEFTKNRKTEVSKFGDVKPEGRQKIPQSRKKFVRYAEGAELYSMSQKRFEKLAKEADACYKMDRMVLVNIDRVDEYLESFRIVCNY